MFSIGITLVSVVVSPLFVAHNVIRKNDLQISYHGSKNNTCDVEDYRFQAIMNSKLSECVIECALREHCAVMNYRPDYKLCELHQINVRTSNLTGNCLRVEREDIHITQSPCTGQPCPNRTACDTKTGACQIKECLEVLRLINGKVRGNLRAVGNQIKYECNEDYQLLNSVNEVATCLENGTWSTRGQCLTAPAVGDLCNATNCLHPSARCVEQSAGGNKYCHCMFGFEFNKALGKCVKVCSIYSTRSSDFVRQVGSRLPSYNLSPNVPVASVEGCVIYCSTNHPKFLGIEVTNDDAECYCASISEQQYVLAHGALVPTNVWSFFNRPCDITVLM